MRTRAEARQTKRQRTKRKTMKLIMLFGAVIMIAVIAILLWNDGVSGPNEKNTEDSNSNPTVTPNLPDSSDDANANDHDDRSNNDAENHSGNEENITSPVVESDEPQIKLTFVGDIMFSGNVEALLEDKGYDYPYVYVRDYLQQADFTIANLETPITVRGEPEEKSYAYRSSPGALPDLAESGIDIVNLANNHILDYGLIGMLDTFEHVDQAGVKRVGAGNNAEEAFAPVIVEKNGVKIAFFGFSQVIPELWWKADRNHPGVAETYDYTRPVKAIESVRAEVDLVVVLAHWGEERTDIPNDKQTEMAHRYIDAGADLVVGGHPHVLQSIEHYKNKWIAYSLGNFIFTTNNEPLTWETVILQANCSKAGDCAIDLVPIVTKWAQPKPMDANLAEALLARINDISINSEIDQDGTVKNKVKPID